MVIGNSGVGKSTLINAVLGDRIVVVRTDELEIRESAEGSETQVPFRMIDTVGFEPSRKNTRNTIRDIKRWSEQSAQEGNEQNQIDMIWFCVDGTAKRLFQETIADLTRATSMWKSVPVIAVITKSYSVPEREENIKMVYDAFVSQKRFSKNLKGVIPVVADTFVLYDDVFAPPEGIEELVQRTNSYLPEGRKAAKEDIGAFRLRTKKIYSHSIVGGATAVGVTIGMVPVPFPDALLLGPTELAMLTALAHIYDIKNDDKSKELFNTMVTSSAVTAAAKTAITALKGIPGINVAAVIVNAVVAGSIVAALGEAAAYAFEQIYLGKKTVDDIDWVTKVVESKLANNFMEKVTEIIQKLQSDADKGAIVKEILDLFSPSKK